MVTISHENAIATPSLQPGRRGLIGCVDNFKLNNKIIF